MRRRLTLKVLYWPTIASTSIIVLLLCVGPFDPWIRPILGRFMPIGRLAPHYLQGSRFGEADGAVGSHESRRLANRRPPQSLFNRSLLGVESLDNVAPQRDNLTGRGPSWHYPSIADRASLLPSVTDEELRLATARLHAPHLGIHEELAGLDLEFFVRESQRQAMLAGLRSASGATKAILVGTNRGAQARVDGVDDEIDFGIAGSDRRDDWEWLPDRRPGESARGYVGDEDGADESEPVRAARSRHGLGGGWPDMPQLIADLRQVAVLARRQSGGTYLISHSAGLPAETDLVDWQEAVETQLNRLRRLPSIASPDSMAILSELQSLAEDGLRAAEAVVDRPAQIACLRAAHALSRRVVIWNAVHQATRSTVSWVGDVDSTWSDRKAVIAQIGQIVAETQATADPTGWSRFLLLDEIAAANESSDEARRRLVAQRFLSRIDWHGLTIAQREWIERETVGQLANSVRRWAVMPVDYASLLGQLERQESDAIDLGGIDVARATQSLRFASSRDAESVGRTLNAHYRNANLRLAVSSSLIERLIPEVDSRIQPVRQRILGADVRGQSFVDSRLAVRLVPSQTTWRLQLETLGNIHARTSSFNGPVAIRNGTQAAFRSVTPLEITSLDAVVGDTGVDVQSQTTVRGIDTDFDWIPLVSTLVREIAMNRYQQLAPLAKQIQHNQIRGSVSSEVDQRVHHQIDEASAKFVRHLVGPLAGLGLSPMVVDMQTTEDRLTARYRIGGDWQLAAFTPRPRAPGDSLFSMQMHQSALNNTLETALPAGKSITIKELVEELRSRFAVPDRVSLVDDDDVELSANTIIHFASTRPITVEIEEDSVWITLRIMRLYSPGSVDLRRFVVRAVYKCEVDGLSANLVRDGHIRISGPGMSMRDRLPARAIFNKVFSINRPLPLIPAGLGEHPAMTGLAISQLELRDGWIGLAIGPASVDRVARSVYPSTDLSPSTD
jgi:hypothetical protein